MKFLLWGVIVTQILFFHGRIWAQSTVKVMSYNTLNFPFGSMPDRPDTLKKILDYVQPDILLLQEVRNSVGLSAVVDYAVTDLPGTYAAAPFVANQSGGSNFNSLQQCLVYNTDIFGVADEYYLTTDLRDINVYKLYFDEEALAFGGDTTFIFAFNTHFKAGTGTDNEQQRLGMANVFVNALSALPSDAYVLFAGDFNVYTSDEPAYQAMLSPLNPIVMEDPIDAPGNWGSNSYPFREIHTQSTRTQNQFFGDGAGGGVDDRFDFILVSENLKSANSPVRYLQGSYKALGNNGTCHNQNITDCGFANEVPNTILSALYHFSDHLPVIMELEFDFELASFSNRKTPPKPLLFAFENSIHTRFTFRHEQCRVLLYDLNGRMVDAFTLRPGEVHSVEHLTPGVYVAVILDHQERTVLGREKLMLH